MSNSPITTGIRKGDVVKLGLKAREKQFVMNVWADNTLQVRQASTGKVRNVAAGRAILWFREGEVASGQRIDRSATDTCPECGDFLSWCPKTPQFHNERETA